MKCSGAPITTTNTTASNNSFVLTSSQASSERASSESRSTMMKGGVGAGGSGGDEARAREGDGNGNGKVTVREPSLLERENNRRWVRRPRGPRKYGNYNLLRHCDNNTVEADGTTYHKGSKPPAGDQLMADIGGSAPVNPDGASHGRTRASSPSDITLGAGGSDGADPVPAWLKNLSKQLSDSSYPNFFMSSSNSNAPATAQNGSPRLSLPCPRKKARYSSPPATPPPSPQKSADEEGLELSLGNAETRMDCA